ncbi:MAG: hypothetical protein IM653_02035 [Phenylobacterium sp.]|nr:hypothetical protein [Phenylobacterium sp.]MCA6226960.1 hypothetical protein [Phenylobacterium sp.]MCA6232789.1 hypothetical protein [Phenylobacterium sp.]MCA6233895.1 hypothetical protein [Phenylobacterium sp.]MCA6249129.1 hypothetical protein [Phenylobacterium sp.]MCA6251999.1 hypothetical protein [Phenylobacterium sp.]
MSDPVTPNPDEKEAARIRRNRLLGRILLIALGLLLIAQMIPFLMRA